MGYRDPDMHNMFLVEDQAADFIVGEAHTEAERLEKLARSAHFRGPEYTIHRKLMRQRAQDLKCIISGLNTGDGVTRRKAAEERRRDK